MPPKPPRPLLMPPPPPPLFRLKTITFITSGIRHIRCDSSSQEEDFTYPCMGRLCVSICDVTSWMFIGRPDKTKAKGECQARKYFFCHFIGRFNRLNGASYHQVGFHCIVSWPSGHLLSFRSGHLQFPGFFPTGHNAPLPSLAFRIQQKVPRNKTYTNEPFQQITHETCSWKQKN